MVWRFSDNSRDRLIDPCPSAADVSEALRRGRWLPDQILEQDFPLDLRIASGQHFTPIEAILRVSEWIDEFGIRSVVDIGSGPGKFCVASALSTNARFTGIEHRTRLVQVARDLARRFALEQRVQFIEGEFGDCVVPDADAYYLYNPFAENLFRPEDGVILDQAVELSESRFIRDVAVAEMLIEDAPVGTYIIKYNGFGGVMPPQYRPLRVDRELPCVLRLWRKESEL